MDHANDAPTIPQHRLSDGTTLPALGFGTYPMRGAECAAAVAEALRAGYRLLDTAVNYGNEEAVGEGLRRSGVDRDQVVVTSKVPGRDHGVEETFASVRGSLERLGLERIDLQLIHWPNPRVDRYVDAWRGLVRAREEGLVRSIGVSNFTEQHLARLVDETGVAPVVNQVEMHPYFPQQDLRAAHERLGVLTQAWSPLGKRQAPFTEPPVADAAQQHGVSPAQVILRWHLQLGSVPIPKSADAERMRSNLDVLGFELGEEELAAITGLGRPDGRLFGGDPDTHEEM